MGHIVFDDAYAAANERSRRAVGKLVRARFRKIFGVSEGDRRLDNMVERMKQNIESDNPR